MVILVLCFIWSFGKLGLFYFLIDGDGDVVLVFCDSLGQGILRSSASSDGRGPRLHIACIWDSAPVRRCSSFLFVLLNCNEFLIHLLVHLVCFIQLNTRDKILLLVLWFLCMSNDSSENIPSHWNLMKFSIHLFVHPVCFIELNTRDEILFLALLFSCMSHDSSENTGICTFSNIILLVVSEWITEKGNYSWMSLFSISVCHPLCLFPCIVLCRFYRFWCCDWVEIKVFWHDMCKNDFKVTSVWWWFCFANVILLKWQHCKRRMTNSCSPLAELGVQLAQSLWFHYLRMISPELAALILENWGELSHRIPCLSHSSILSNS